MGREGGHVIICNYKNYNQEWIDAKKELAFHNGEYKQAVVPYNNNNNTPTISAEKSCLSPRFGRIRHHITHKWYIIKNSIRRRIERCTVYVLECEDGKYYVGSTTNRKRRYDQHARRRGSKWTKTYAPLYVMKEYKRIPAKYLLGFESKVTAEVSCTYICYHLNNQVTWFGL